jgi:hypothetical protein
LAGPGREYRANAALLEKPDRRKMKARMINSPTSAWPDREHVAPTDYQDDAGGNLLSRCVRRGVFRVAPSAGAVMEARLFWSRRSQCSISGPS